MISAETVPMDRTSRTAVSHSLLTSDQCLVRKLMHYGSDRAVLVFLQSIVFCLRGVRGVSAVHRVDSARCFVRGAS